MRTVSEKVYEQRYDKDRAYAIAVSRNYDGFQSISKYGI